MVYRGIVSNGVVVLEGDRPPDGAQVEVAPIRSNTSEELPAFGIWRDRTDLPKDSGKASLELRRKVEQRKDGAKAAD